MAVNLTWSKVPLSRCLHKKYHNSIVKVIEVIATSDQGFTEADQEAVVEASKTVKNIKSIYIKEMNANVEDNQIVSTR